MPGFVYILKSLKNGKYYIGRTSDIENRLNHHNSGATPFTRNNKPFVLIFSQQYEDMVQARLVENWLKKSKSKELINRIITENKITKTF